MTDLPRAFSSASATGRAARSACPPAGNGTIIVILRVGHGPCANAELASAARASGKAAAALKNSRRFIGSFLPGDFCLVVGCNVAEIAPVGQRRLCRVSTVTGAVGTLRFAHPTDSAASLW